MTSHILIVDDNPDIVRMIRRVLRGEGHELTTTTDPREAVELLGTERFDLLLCDVDMPHLTGHDVTRAARERSPSTVRVLVTGTATMDAAVRAINEGEVHRFVRKPFDAHALRRVVRGALARKAELALVAEADQRARRRILLLEQLEAEHPGVTHIERAADGLYEIDGDAAARVAERLGMGPFVTTKS